MQNDILVSLSRLSDDELVARVRNLAARERDAMAQLVAHLAELDTRDLHLREGYGSLFAYCRDALALSEHEAYNRIEAARAARRFPVILEMLAEGSVNLMTVRLLAPHLTPDNHRRVLESARGKRKSEVEEIVARLSPRSDVAPSRTSNCAVGVTTTMRRERTLGRSARTGVAVSCERGPSRTVFFGFQAGNRAVNVFQVGANDRRSATVRVLERS